MYAIHILENNLDKIDWELLSETLNTIDLLKIVYYMKNIITLIGGWLSANPNAINLLEQNYNKINWIVICSNLNAIHLFENNLDKIHWKNTNTIHLLKARIEYNNLRNKIDCL